MNFFFLNQQEENAEQHLILVSNSSGAFPLLKTSPILILSSSSRSLVFLIEVDEKEIVKRT